MKSVLSQSSIISNTAPGNSPHRGSFSNALGPSLGGSGLITREGSEQRSALASVTMEHTQPGSLAASCNINPTDIDMVLRSPSAPMMQVGAD